MQMVGGQNYSLYINWRACNAKLEEIHTYNSMPSDYHFIPLKGEVPIISITAGNDYFPGPRFMLDMMDVDTID